MRTMVVKVAAVAALYASCAEAFAPAPVAGSLTPALSGLCNARVSLFSPALRLLVFLDQRPRRRVLRVRCLDMSVYTYMVWKPAPVLHPHSLVEPATRQQHVSVACVCSLSVCLMLALSLSLSLSLSFCRAPQSGRTALYQVSKVKNENPDDFAVRTNTHTHTRTRALTCMHACIYLTHKHMHTHAHTHAIAK